MNRSWAAPRLAGSFGVETRRGDSSWLAALFLVGLGVRLIAIAGLAQPPQRDELDYHRIAVNLLAGGGYGLEPARLITSVPPLYPAFLAAVYLVFGEDYRVVWYVQAVLNAASVLLVYLLGRTLFSRAVGLIASGIFALYPSFEIVTSLHRENLLIPLLLGFVYALVRAIREGSIVFFLLAGLTSGLLALTNPVLPGLPLAVAALGLLDRRVRPRWPWFVSIVLLSMAVWMPWHLRNSRVAGESADGTEYAYLALAFGHYPVFSGSFWWPVSDMQALERERERAREFLKERERALPGLGAGDRLARAWHDLAERIRARPLAYLKFVLNRDLIFLISPPPGSSALRRAAPGLDRVAFAANALFVALAVAFLIRTYRTDAAAFSVVATVAYLLVVYGLIHSIRRYGYVVWPVWMVFGAQAFWRAGSGVKERGTRDIVKRAWYALLPHRPYAYLGRWVVRLAPASYVSRVREEFFTGRGPSGVVGDAVRAELSRQYYSSSEQEIRKRSRVEFWGSRPGKRWHDLVTERSAEPESFHKDYLAPRLPLVAQLADLISTDSRYHTICEIGTGNGMFLKHLSGQFRMMRRFVGIDLNREQIAENQDRYKGERLEFAHAEITGWLRTRCERGTIFVGCETFEFFTYSELREVFGLIRERASPAAVGVFALVTPGLGPDVISAPRGSTAYSHNYVRVFRECGYEIFRHRMVRATETGGPYDIFIGVGVTSLEDRVGGEETERARERKGGAICA